MEFYLCRELGEPAYTKGNGESFWDTCPACGATGGKFCTRPVPAEAGVRWKHRAHCYACDTYDDLVGWMRLLDRSLSYAAALDAQSKLLDEFDAWTAANAAGPEPPTRPTRNTAPPLNSPRGTGAGGSRRAKADCFRCRHADPAHIAFIDEGEDAVLAARAKVEALLTGLDPAGDEALARLAVAVAALEAVEEFDAHPEAVKHDLSCQLSFRVRDREHRDGCVDPECDAVTCRLARGETQEAIDADLKAQQVARQARLKAGGRPKRTPPKPLNRPTTE